LTVLARTVFKLMDFNDFGGLPRISNGTENPLAQKPYGAVARADRLIMQQSASTTSLGTSVSVSSLFSVASDTAGPPAVAPPSSAPLPWAEFGYPVQQVPIGSHQRNSSRSTNTSLTGFSIHSSGASPTVGQQTLIGGEHAMSPRNPVDVKYPGSMAGLQQRTPSRTALASGQGTIVHHYKTVYTSQPVESLQCPPAQPAPHVTCSQPTWVIEEVIDFDIQSDDAGDIHTADDCGLLMRSAGRAGLCNACGGSVGDLKVADM